MDLTQGVPPRPGQSTSERPHPGSARQIARFSASMRLSLAALMLAELARSEGAAYARCFPLVAPSRDFCGANMLANRAFCLPLLVALYSTPVAAHDIYSNLVDEWRKL